MRELVVVQGVQVSSSIEFNGNPHEPAHLLDIESRLTSSNWIEEAHDKRLGKRGKRSKGECLLLATVCGQSNCCRLHERERDGCTFDHTTPRGSFYCRFCFDDCPTRMYICTHTLFVFTVEGNRKPHYIVEFFLRVSSTFAPSDLQFVELDDATSWAIYPASVKWF